MRKRIIPGIGVVLFGCDGGDSEYGEYGGAHQTDSLKTIEAERCINCGLFIQRGTLCDCQIGFFSLTKLLPPAGGFSGSELDHPWGYDIGGSD